MKTNIKLRVTPEQSEAVQKICFANGINWIDGRNTPMYLNFEYLFIEPTRIWFREIANHDSGIETEGYIEVDADLFIRTNGTCEELITQQELDDMLNNKSKEDMFKQYGFEVPDFDCTILTKVNHDYVGYVIQQIYYSSILDIKGTCYTGVTYASKHNLTPIKQPWYKTCKFPVLVWDIFADKLEVATEYTNDTLYLLSDIRNASEVRPLSNEEIDQLKQDF